MLTDLDDRSSRLWQLLVGTALVTAAYIVLVGLQVGGDRTTRAVDDLGDMAAALLAVVLSLVRITRTAGRERIGWLMVAAFTAALGLGDSLYAYYDLVLGVPVPFPSLPDLAYLSGSVIGIVAVLVLASPTWVSSGLRSVLDGAIVAGALLVLSWLTVLHTVYEQGGEGTLGFITSLAYPVADVLTAGVALSAITHSRRVQPHMILIGVALLVLAISDSAYTYLEVHDLYHGSNVIDGGYVAGYLLIAVATQAHRPRALEPVGGSLARWQLVLPYIPFIVACLLAAMALLSNHRMDMVGEILVAVVLALVLVRQLAAVSEAHALTIRLDATVAALEDAVQRWKDAASDREIVIEQAPVGICRLDRRGEVLTANAALQRMLGCGEQDIVGHPVCDLIHPADVRSQESYRRLAAGTLDRLAIEGKLLRSDGRPLWCSEVAIPLHRAKDGPPEFIAILEDISERHRDAEQAAEIQRHLFPQTVPSIAGYDLAGECRPAKEVAGDFYDWMATDGHVDVTVADVMGKGIGPALVMSALRMALRSNLGDLGPAALVQRGAASLALDGQSAEGLFVTLFHGRLEPATGELRYVDAGHGYCAIRRRDGRLERLAARSLPLGIEADQTFEEGTARMEPGDVLIVHSDGLVETPERTATLDELLPDRCGLQAAGETVRSLMGRVPQPAGDDVTVLVLRRLPQGELPDAAPVAVPGRRRGEEPRTVAHEGALVGRALRPF